MPFTTVFATTNEGLSTVVVNDSCPSVDSREAKATSDGEKVRVGTRPEGGFVESRGKTR